ncbi:MAG: MoxR family ATPase [Bacteroidales bacterium]|jgi:MoxR-like ATPase|nr:MoxR family ATPase [Bacteroidales bacterium]HOI31612.1 MoxR family ATPase [Bacteroidales bacterium]
MFKSDKEGADALQLKYQELKKEIGKVIVGQDEIIHQTLLAIFSQGHVLLVGVPGLAKTLLVNTIGKALGLSFSRIQFTPDLMPSDIIGTEILDETRHFKFIKGPVFAQVILADEINRTPPKTQAALLEAMQEKRITVAGQTHQLLKPFFVLATQNPIEQEGTYPLPEAQLDRFMFNLWLDYPAFEEEIMVVKQTTGGAEQTVNAVMNENEINYFQQLVRKVPVPDNVYEYAVKLVGKTRPNTPEAHDFTNRYISWGAGPRASQYLIIGAKANALFHGRYSPDIEDVKTVSLPILRHRLVRNYTAEAEGIGMEDIIRKLL